MAWRGGWGLALLLGLVGVLGRFGLTIVVAGLCLGSRRPLPRVEVLCAFPGEGCEGVGLAAVLSPDVEDVAVLCLGLDVVLADVDGGPKQPCRALFPCLAGFDVNIFEPGLLEGLLDLWGLPAAWDAENLPVACARCGRRLFLGR